MQKLFQNFWLTFTIIITFVFVLVFPLQIISSVGILDTIVYTITGVSIIWLIYLVRSNVFSGMFNIIDQDEQEKSNH